MAMMRFRNFFARDTRRRRVVLYLLLALLLAGLPLSVWLDLRALSEDAMRRQAGDLNGLITAIRGFYAANVVGRVLASPGATQVVHNYESIAGAIPIPATMSLELGRLVEEQKGNISYRFVSDFPFKNRASHALDGFETASLAMLRMDPSQQPVDISWSGFTARARLVTPVLMGAVCVNCHNTHPESPKRDWKVGDVRGIQEVIVTQTLAANIFSFKYLIIYFVLTGAVGLAFILAQHHQAALVRAANHELEHANQFLASISLKISRYLAPQIYKSIFSGQKDVTIQTERKKLTIFFSDIKDFTATTERLQPEEITALLNEYFTEMSAIALLHGGTVDKFIGDAVLVFFGDPETKGVAEDARACLRMAIDMQGRLTELNAKWRNSGIEHPFRVRMGINTGFCNVGNFGSNDRMDYTIIGAEANLAARLQSIAEPGKIVISYETFALVREIVTARPMPAISMKGIGREVIPYDVDGLLNAADRKRQVFSEHTPGLDLHLDLSLVDQDAAKRLQAVLREATAALERRGPGGAATRDGALS